MGDLFRTTPFFRGSYIIIYYHNKYYWSNVIMELAYVLTLYLISMKEISIPGHSNFLRTQNVDSH